MVTHRGGCHCGRVRFEVDSSPDLKLSDCNCSICRMTGYQHLTVEKSAFRLLQGRESISIYRFNTGVAKHYFCSQCGIKSFYVPRSYPDRISVNARCLNPENITSTDIVRFDGRNWEQNIDALRVREL